MELTSSKPFEIPDAGLFLGTIIDVVDMPNVQTQYGPKNKVRLLWVLGSTTAGQRVVDSESKPLTVAFIKNGSWNEKSELYKMVRMILNAAPPLITKTEELSALLIGRSNQLFITLTANEKQPGQNYANVTGVMPLAPGQVPPQTPAGFVRAKDKPKTVAGPNGQPVQTYVAPQAPQQTVSYVVGQTTSNTQATAPVSKTSLSNLSSVAKPAESGLTGRRERPIALSEGTS